MSDVQTHEAKLSDLDLAALLCSRVCHDVISPVGAIANGLELIDDPEMDAETKETALEMVRTSAPSITMSLLSLRRRAHPLAWPSQRADGAYLAVFSMMAGARRAAARTPARRRGHAMYDAVGIRVRADSESPGSSEGETAPRCDSVRGPPHSRRVKLGYS